MPTLTPETESLIYRVIGCAITVHTQMGPGLLESVYRDCMLIELRAAGLKVLSEQRVRLSYRGCAVSEDLVLDVLVEQQLVLELKAVERILEVHLAQLITYLKLADKPAGLLINFNTTSLRAGGIRRVTHPSLYKKGRIVDPRNPFGYRIPGEPV